MPKAALIFGITGQDGSYLAEELLNRGYRVTGVARRVSTDNTQRLSGVLGQENFQLVAGDVTDPFCVLRLLDQAVIKGDILEVYNLAAQSHVGVSFGEPRHTWDVTAVGPLNILEAIRALPLGDRERVRFYQASSSEMFGSAISGGYIEYRDFAAAQDGLLTDDEAIERGRAKRVDCYQDESTPMRPNSPYAIAKLAAHNLVRVYRDSYGLHASSGILFNHESERRSDSFVTRKITKWAAANLRRPLIPLSALRLKLGNLDAKRDWGHAADYVHAMWLMLQQEKPDDYVIATGETHSVLEFLNEVFRVCGMSAGTPVSEFVDIDRSLFRPNEVPFLRGDSSKAREKLGWEPQVSFTGLVRRMLAADLPEVA